MSETAFSKYALFDIIDGAKQKTDFLKDVLEYDKQYRLGVLNSYGLGAKIMDSWINRMPSDMRQNLQTFENMVENEGAWIISMMRLFKGILSNEIADLGANPGEGELNGPYADSLFALEAWMDRAFENFAIKSNGGWIASIKKGYAEWRRDFGATFAKGASYRIAQKGVENIKGGDSAATISELEEKMFVSGLFDQYSGQAMIGVVLDLILVGFLFWLFLFVISPQYKNTTPFAVEDVLDLTDGEGKISMRQLPHKSVSEAENLAKLSKKQALRRVIFGALDQRIHDMKPNKMDHVIGVSPLDLSEETDNRFPLVIYLTPENPTITYLPKKLELLLTGSDGQLGKTSINIDLSSGLRSENAGGAWSAIVEYLKRSPNNSKLFAPLHDFVSGDGLRSLIARANIQYQQDPQALLQNLLLKSEVPMPSGGGSLFNQWAMVWIDYVLANKPVPEGQMASIMQHFDAFCDFSALFLGVDADVPADIKSVLLSDGVTPDVVWKKISRSREFCMLMLTQNPLNAAFLSTGLNKTLDAFREHTDRSLESLQELLNNTRYTDTHLNSAPFFTLPLTSAERMDPKVTQFIESAKNRLTTMFESRYPDMLKSDSELASKVNATALAWGVKCNSFMPDVIDKENFLYVVEKTFKEQDQESWRGHEYFTAIVEHFGDPGATEFRVHEGNRLTAHLIFGIEWEEAKNSGVWAFTRKDFTETLALGMIQNIHQFKHVSFLQQTQEITAYTPDERAKIKAELDSRGLVRAVISELKRIDEQFRGAEAFNSFASYSLPVLGGETQATELTEFLTSTEFGVRANLTQSDKNTLVQGFLNQISDVKFHQGDRLTQACKTLADFKKALQSHKANRNVYANPVNSARAKELLAHMSTLRIYLQARALSEEEMEKMHVAEIGSYIKELPSYAANTLKSQELLKRLTEGVSSLGSVVANVVGRFEQVYEVLKSASYKVQQTLFDENSTTADKEAALIRFSADYLHATKIPLTSTEKRLLDAEMGFVRKNIVSYFTGPGNQRLKELESELKRLANNKAQLALAWSDTMSFFKEVYIKGLEDSIRKNLTWKGVDITPEVFKSLHDRLDLMATEHVEMGAKHLEARHALDTFRGLVSNWTQLANSTLEIDYLSGLNSTIARLALIDTSPLSEIASYYNKTWNLGDNRLTSRDLQLLVDTTTGSKASPSKTVYVKETLERFLRLFSDNGIQKEIELNKAFFGTYATDPVIQARKIHLSRAWHGLRAYANGTADFERSIKQFLEGNQKFGELMNDKAVQWTNLVGDAEDAFELMGPTVKRARIWDVPVSIKTRLRLNSNFTFGQIAGKAADLKNYTNLMSGNLALSEFNSSSIPDFGTPLWDRPFFAFSSDANGLLKKFVPGVPLERQKEVWELLGVRNQTTIDTMSSLLKDIYEKQIKTDPAGHGVASGALDGLQRVLQEVNLKAVVGRQMNATQLVSTDTILLPVANVSNGRLFNGDLGRRLEQDQREISELTHNVLMGLGVAGLMFFISWQCMKGRDRQVQMRLSNMLTKIKNVDWAWFWVVAGGTSTLLMFQAYRSLARAIELTNQSLTQVLWSGQSIVSRVFDFWSSAEPLLQGSGRGLLWLPKSFWSYSTFTLEQITSRDLLSQNITGKLFNISRSYDNGKQYDPPLFPESVPISQLVGQLETAQASGFPFVQYVLFLSLAGCALHLSHQLAKKEADQMARVVDFRRDLSGPHRSIQDSDAKFTLIREDEVRRFFKEYLYFSETAHFWNTLDGDKSKIRHLACTMMNYQELPSKHNHVNAFPDFSNYPFQYHDSARADYIETLSEYQKILKSEPLILDHAAHRLFKAVRNTTGNNPFLIYTTNVLVSKDAKNLKDERRFLFQLSHSLEQCFFWSYPDFQGVQNPQTANEEFVMVPFGFNLLIWLLLPGIDQNIKAAGETFVHDQPSPLHALFLFYRMNGNQAAEPDWERNPPDYGLKSGSLPALSQIIRKQTGIPSTGTTHSLLTDYLERACKILLYLEKKELFGESKRAITVQNLLLDFTNLIDTLKKMVESFGTPPAATQATLLDQSKWHLLYECQGLLNVAEMLCEILMDLNPKLESESESEPEPEPEPKPKPKPEPEPKPKPKPKPEPKPKPKPKPDEGFYTKYAKKNKNSKEQMKSRNSEELKEQFRNQVAMFGFCHMPLHFNDLLSHELILIHDFLDRLKFLGNENISDKILNQGGSYTNQARFNSAYELAKNYRASYLKFWKLDEKKVSTLTARMMLVIQQLAKQQHWFTYKKETDLFDQIDAVNQMFETIRQADDRIGKLGVCMVPFDKQTPLESENWLFL